MGVFEVSQTNRKSARPYAWVYSGIAIGLYMLTVLFVRQSWVGSASLNDTRAVSRTIASRGDLSSDEKSTIALFRQASPAVVNITAIGVQRDFFTLNLYQIPEVTGSGFVWDTTGNVITNFHVIHNADAAQVTLADQSAWKARIVGVAPDKDIAVLRIDAPANRLRPIPIGTSKELQVGQKVFAIGNPFGLDQTLTTGVISALGREIESVTRRPIQGVIQSDAAINPGNSGGPLLDSAGRLIGVNTAIYSPSGGSAGIGFAVPVDTVRRVVPQLIGHGRYAPPSLGVEVDPQINALAARQGLEGALVLGITPGSAAERAGLRPARLTPDGRIVPGDVIVGLDGTEIATANDLYAALEQHTAGETVRVEVIRDGAPLTLETVLDP